MNFLGTNGPRSVYNYERVLVITGIHDFLAQIAVGVFVIICPLKWK